MSHSAPAAPRARRALVDRIWESFTSLRLTILLLIAIALACALGTFTSPTAIAPEKLQAAFVGPALWLIRFFELGDVFHAWWFTLLLLALALNLIACSVERLPQVYRVAFQVERRLTAKVLEGARHEASLPGVEDPAEGARRLAELMRARGFAPSIEVEEGEQHLYAEKGKGSRLGVYLVHVALLLVLGGGIVGRIAGYSGQALVEEGGGVIDDMLVSAADGRPYHKPLGFEVRLDAFRVRRFASGAPLAYESDLVVLEGGQEVARQRVSVNHPLHYRGWTFYQSSFQVSQELVWLKLTVPDGKGGRRQLRVRPREGVALEPGVALAPVGYDPSFSGKAPAVRLLRIDERAGTETLEWLAQGQTGAPVEFLGLDDFYLSGIQVARDPGAGIVLSGCLALFCGLMLAFSATHRRLWARVSLAEVVLAGAAHKGQPAFERMFRELVAEARRALSS